MSTTTSSTGLLLPTMTLWKREMVRFFRQRSRLAGALLTPLVFWLLLGSGFNKDFGSEAMQQSSQAVGYMEYFFPGTVVLILLFTAIFSTISVIEDRKEGFMQAVLVSPAPRQAIVLGKVFGGASIATVQGVLFLLIWPFISEGGYLNAIYEILLAIPVMFVLAVGLTSLGMCLAWKVDSTAGFHAIMNLFLMPMWFLSGAMFPITEKTPIIMKVLMWANPLTYGQATFTYVLTSGRVPVGAPGTPYIWPAISVVVVIGIIGLAVQVVSKPRKDGLP
jgi:ABC-2 type transport system permease protein